MQARPYGAGVRRCGAVFGFIPSSEKSLVTVRQVSKPTRCSEWEPGRTERSWAKLYFLSLRDTGDGIKIV